MYALVNDKGLYYNGLIMLGKGKPMPWPLLRPKSAVLYNTREDAEKRLAELRLKDVVVRLYCSDLRVVYVERSSLAL